MAAASYVPTKLGKALWNGSAPNLLSDTIKCMGVVAGSGIPDTTKTGIEFVSDVTAANTEVSGTGYSRQTLASKTFAYDSSGTRLVDFGFANITFSQGASAPTNFRYFIIFKDAGGADSANQVILVFDPNATYSQQTGDIVLGARPAALCRCSAEMSQAGIAGIGKSPVTLQGAIATNFATAAPALAVPADNVALEAATVPAQSLTTSDPVSVTGAPRAIGAFIDVTNFPAGTNAAVALQMDFGAGNGFETAAYFTITERGLMLDGVTPATEAGIMIKTPFPLPDCVAQILVIADQEFKTTALVRF